MTVYGYFGTMAETTLKYTRDFPKFPIIIRVADLTETQLKSYRDNLTLRRFKNTRQN